MNSSIQLQAQTEPVFTPIEVVVQWMAWYPEYLNNAVALTTNNLRGGLLQQDWIHQRQELVDQLGYMYLTAKVLAMEVQGLEATVTIMARLFFTIGEIM